MQPVTLPQTVQAALSQAKAIMEGACGRGVTGASAEGVKPLVEENLLLRAILGTVLSASWTPWMILGEEEDVDDETVAEEGDDTGHTGRLTAKDLFGLQGSATGTQSLMIGRAKAEAKRQRDEQVLAARMERGRQEEGQCGRPGG